MVHQSELAFRMLARRHGADLCYTEMLHSTNFVEQPAYREQHLFRDLLPIPIPIPTPAAPPARPGNEAAAAAAGPGAEASEASGAFGDRPLIVQFCGDKPEVVAQASARGCTRVHAGARGLAPPRPARVPARPHAHRMGVRARGKLASFVGLLRPRERAPPFPGSLAPGSPLLLLPAPVPRCPPRPTAAHRVGRGDGGPARGRHRPQLRLPASNRQARALRRLPPR